MKNYKMIPKIALWSLLGLGIVFIALFFSCSITIFSASWRVW